MDLKLQVLLQMLDKASAPLKQVTGAGSKAAAQLKKTRDTLRELDKQQAQMTGFRKLKNDAAAGSLALKAAQQQARKLRTEMAAGDGTSRKAAAAYARAEQQVNKLKTAQMANLRAVRAGREALTAAGVGARTFGTAEERLRNDIGRTTRSIEQQTAAMRAQGVLAQRNAKLHAQLAKGQALGTHLSVTGYAAYEGGRRILEGIHPMLDEGKQYQTNIAQLRAQGTSSADIALAERFANTDSTRGSSVNDKLEVLKDANSIFRDMHEALAVAPQLLKAKYTFEGLMASHGEGSGHGAETVNQLIDAIRTGELRNATKTPEDFQHLLDLMSRAYVGSGGLVKPSDYLHTMKVGGVATKQMDDKSLFFGAMHTIQEMGGMRAGTGFASAYQNWAAGRSTQQTAEALSQLGLVNKDAVKYGKTGHITKLLPGALVNQGLYESNPFEYMMKEVIPRINPTGKLSENEVVSKLNSLFSARKGGDLFAGMYMQRGNIEKQLRASQHFASLNSTYAQTGNTAQGEELDLEAKKRDLYLVLGRQLLPVYVSALQKMVNVLRALTTFARNHPAIARAVTVVAGTFGVLMVAAGGLMIALGGLVGMFAVLRFAVGKSLLGFTARRVAGASAAAAGGESAGIGLLARARGLFPAMAGGARAAMLAITGVSAPVLALIAVLVAAALVVRKYWGPIKAFFVGVGQGISQVMGPAFDELGQALAPLKPVWDGIASALSAVWQWLGQLLAPFQATQDQLAGATANGVTFGRVLGYVLGAVVTAVKWAAKAFTWVGTAIGEGIGAVQVYGGKAIDWLGTTWSTVSDAVKAPFVAAFAWISDKIDAFMEKWRALKAKLGIGDTATAAPGIHWNTGGADDNKPLPRFAIDSRPPLKAGGATVVTNNHYPINVTAAPGREPDAAKAVSAELDRRDRAAAAANRSKLGDTE